MQGILRAMIFFRKKKPAPPPPPKEVVKKTEPPLVSKPAKSLSEIAYQRVLTAEGWRRSATKKTPKKPK